MSLSATDLPGQRGRAPRPSDADGFADQHDGGPPRLPFAVDEEHLGGLVTRTAYPVVPPRVEYALTPSGHTLLMTVRELIAWADEHTGDIDAARARYDARPTPHPG